MKKETDNFSRVGAVILAAGKGTRLKCVDKPKVMLELNGRPMISYTVETLKKIPLTPTQICLVVGFCKEKVMDYFGDKVSYAEQAQQLGTAHAAYTGIKQIRYRTGRG
jgi:bifunctional N-acetylglucosamine-1-phosphate-uridyltransferase/glucosamine-1-phosphate-acetyltransferase GlmU-like protein